MPTPKSGYGAGPGALSRIFLGPGGRKGLCKSHVFPAAAHLVGFLDFPLQLHLLVVEVSPGEHLLTYLALPFSLGYDGLSVGHHHLHVPDHLLLLLQQLPVLDLGAQDRETRLVQDASCAGSWGLTCHSLSPAGATFHRTGEDIVRAMNSLWAAGTGRNECKRTRVIARCGGAHL